MGGKSHATFVVGDGSAVFNGTCAIVDSLQAPGFCSAATERKLGASCADVSAHINGSRQLTVRSTTPADEGFKGAFRARGVPIGRSDLRTMTVRAPRGVSVSTREPSRVPMKYAATAPPSAAGDSPAGGLVERAGGQRPPPPTARIARSDNWRLAPSANAQGARSTPRAWQ